MSVVNHGIQTSISLNRAAYIMDIAHSETGIDGRNGIGISEASAYEENQQVYSPDTFIFAIGNFIEYNAHIKNIFYGKSNGVFQIKTTRPWQEYLLRKE